MKIPNVKIGYIAQRYIDIASNNREVSRSSGPSRAKTKPPTAQNSDPRFKDPAFRLAVRTVLTHLGYKPTMGNFKLHDSKYGASMPFNWMEMSKNQGISLNHPEPGIYFETHTGTLIEMGKCLNSIKKLTEFNNRRSTK